MVIQYYIGLYLPLFKVKTSVEGKNNVFSAFRSHVIDFSNPCATQVQGEFETFPHYLHCHYHNILINVLFMLAKDGCVNVMSYRVKAIALRTLLVLSSDGGLTRTSKEN